MKNKDFNELVMVNSQEQEAGDISNLSFEEQDKLRSSWIQLEALLANFEKLSNKEANVLKVENTNIESVRESSQEIYDFYSKFFSGEENADPKQIEIGIANNIVDTYIGRGADGKIASILQSQRVEIPATEMGRRPELMHLIWYVATDKNYQGPRLTPDLFRLAMTDILNQSKN